MLNDFLKLTDTDDATSSHSLKATTLVWAARYGIDDDSRAMLGHHSIQNKSVACYSRDLLAKPLRELCGMLLNAAASRTEAGAESVVPSPSTIVEEAPQVEVEKVDASAMETFDPTNPFQMPEAQEEGSEAVHEADVVEGDDLLESASSESGESACGTEVNEEIFHQKRNSVLNSGVEPVVAGALMQNKRSRMVAPPVQ
eukprot:s1579_g30.t1